ncbi:RIP metalloprotease RseP [Caldisericum exile]|uniref:Zinc metalloprotease n=1 Tax=Caldisericum exile (strain DSM 21853 / NBRC 104410 / AZM16c01) TaxID=511051 RepID=A0A7U6GEN7_CALEA|nr:RIP metalloprotease RseP [Caldisericum exile]BAL80937.1 putative M50 family peptidase [Caldisericum exile AZM16c01]
MSGIIYATYGILIISFLALAHEFGHFLIARISNIPVEEFAIGFGPTIYEHKPKETNGMKFKIGLFPILGYVKIKGMEDNYDDPESFYNRGFFAKFFTILGGPLMNLVVAIIIFGIVFGSFGNPLSPTTTIASVVKGSPAEIAGLKPGDTILKVNDLKIRTWSELVNAIQENKENIATIEIKRENEILKIQVVPKFDPTQKKWMIGISPKGEVYSTGKSFIEGMKWTFSTLFQMFTFLPKLFTRAGVTSITGPIGIISMTGEAASAGFLNLLFFIAYISIALAFTNLLPIPPLDGSWLIIIIAEGVSGRKIPKDLTAKIQSIALIFMLILMFVVSINDILKLINK